LEKQKLPNNSFPDRVQTLVNLVGSKEKLAKRCQVSATMITRYAEGKGEPARDKLIAMAQATDTSLLWLANGEGPMMQADLVITTADGTLIVECKAQGPRSTVCEPGSGTIYKTNYDAELEEIVGILQNDLPEAKKFVLKVLHGKKEVKEGMEGLLHLNEDLKEG
jgi:hypothetical protein